MSRLSEDDPFWALEVMNHYRRLMTTYAERQLASQMVTGSALRPEETFLGPEFDMPEATPERIRRVAADLLGDVPAGIQEGSEDELMWRMMGEGEDIALNVLQKVEAQFQCREDLDPHVYICVTRDSISITRVTPYKIDLG